MWMSPNVNNKHLQPLDLSVNKNPQVDLRFDEHVIKPHEIKIDFLVSVIKSFNAKCIREFCIPSEP